MIFAMVSTRRSLAYTELALPSFFRHTPLTARDKVLLIVNDQGGMPDFGAMGIDRSRLDVIAHAAPKSFAENVNLALREAAAERCGLVFLNNDIVFTPDWLSPLVEHDDAITLPTCNQQYQYRAGALRLAFVMSLADFGGRQQSLDAVAARHAAGCIAGPWRRDILMSFYCVHIPHRVQAAVGVFDETFGSGGGEDVDYRIRALLAGFDVRYATRSYVLHFMGRSTWRSGEPRAETAARDARYRSRFEQKWGERLSRLMLAGRDAPRIAQDLGVGPDMERGNYAAAIRKLLPAREPDAPHGSGVVRSSVCLSMIVKNEAPVIRRCLASVRPLIDHWIVVDTGSTDGTQGIIRETLADLPGTLHERPWRDFAHNRSEALALARPHADYALIIDADDTFEVPAGFAMPDLDADLYTVDVVEAEITYRRTQLVRNRLPSRYVGVLHDYLACEGECSIGHLPVAMRRHDDGARRRDPETYRKDVAILEGALETETDSFLRSRYTFYLAQSYRDCGQRRPAIQHYLRRAELGYWNQEVFQSLLNAGTLMADAGEPTDAVLAVLDRAGATAPERAEAIHAAARICRERGEHRRAVEVAARGLGLRQPASGLYLQPWIYEVGLLDEFAVSAYRVGRHIDCLVACAIILSRPGLDDRLRQRIRSNRDSAFDQVAARSSLWIETLSADRAPRVAIVTPYFREAVETLRRGVRSVKRQTVPTDHIVVADGHPQDWLDGEVSRHVKLDRGGADYGNTPRAIGGMLAASGRYTAIGFLDADCWLDDDHVESCLRAALATGLDTCGTVTTFRTFRRPDLSPMPLDDEDPDRFVDTNCYFLLPRSYGLIAIWSLIPKTLDWIGDRVFFLCAKQLGHLTGRTRHRSVNYVTTYEVAYRAIGEAPPPGAKERPDHRRNKAWIDALPPESLDVLRRQLGVDLRALYHHEHCGAAATTAPATAGARDEAS